MKLSQAKSNQVKSNQVKSSQAKPSQVKSSQVESSHPVRPLASLWDCWGSLWDCRGPEYVGTQSLGARGQTSPCSYKRRSFVAGRGAGGPDGGLRGEGGGEG